MKIVFVTNICSHYRIKTFETLARYYDTNFYFYSDGRESYWEKRNKLHLGRFKGKYLKGFYISPKVRITPSLISKLLLGKYDCFIKCTNGRFALPVTFLTTKLKRKPFILWTGMWMHPKTLFHKMSFPLLRFIYLHSDSIVVYGEHVKRYLTSLGVPPEKIFTAWNTVDNSLFNKPVKENKLTSLRNELQVKGKKIILFVGRLEKEKGLFYLLEAFGKIDRNDMVLIIIGEGSEKSKLLNICNSKRFDNVLFLDYIDNKKLYLYYALADVFVLPSVTTISREPWGLVVNEAFNQGCPVVVTDAVGAGVGGLVRNGVNGFVVPERNSNKLTEAMAKILFDEELRQYLSRNASQEIKRWTYERQAQGFLDAVKYAIND